jgi:S-adenosylmethionine:tRNA ribosyltransferase-isomerase
MNKSDFTFVLPQELIAQDPLKDRSGSRLMVLNKNTGEIAHRMFRDVMDYLQPGDCLVLNDTKVMPARLIGVKEDTGAHVEVLLLNRRSTQSAGAANISNQPMLDGSEPANQSTVGNTKPTSKPKIDSFETATHSTVANAESVTQPSIGSTELANRASIVGMDEVISSADKFCLNNSTDTIMWEALVKPGRKCKVGTILNFGGDLLSGEVLDTLEGGNRLIRFTFQGIWEELLDQLGEMPLPPYITHKLQDKSRYQTVYAREVGSAAAPTAGLHFTQELLAKIREKGVDIAYVTLHVGLGTFRPVKVEDVLQHHMHEEEYEISQAAADRINSARCRGGRIICVGTTSCRTIESAGRAAGKGNPLIPGRRKTDIFLYPGCEFYWTDALITNFHLPESTLLMLVSALAGREHVLHAYQEAIKEHYRFFSFGDAMLIIST